MKHVEFVHLHNHSDYSLLDGASPIPRMVKRAAELKMPALALTDHGSLFGAVEFYLEARKAGVKPIVGMEAYVTRGSRRDRLRETVHHLVLLAKDEEGFRNLMKLSSLAFLEGFYYKPRVDHDILAQYSKGLIALSACPAGEVADDLMADRDQDALKTAMMYRDMFGADNYFLEVQHHGLDFEEKIRGKVRWLARETGLPVVATNDCHYIEKDHVDAQDVLLCIQTGKVLEDQNRMRSTANLHFRSLAEMTEVFKDFPEALANTVGVAERCNLQMNFGKPLLPAFPLPAGEESAEAYLHKLAWAGLEGRFPEPGEDLRKRLEYELDVICRMGFASYMLIVRDFIDFARKQGIGVGPGRGSVAGSLVAYALRITNVDPIKNALYFERFLNPERVTMPDIDIDFDDLRRGEVIQYVRAKYGENNVTQIITFGTMGAKGVVRDVGRALGMAFAEVDKIAKMVPDGLGMTLERAIELSGDLRNLPQRGPMFGRLLNSARVLEGLARHASTHAAGVLITPGPLLDYVPLYRQKDESVTTQWDMRACEKAGLLKMDFLGLRTLSVLDEAVRLIEQVHGTRIDLATLSEEDEATYKVFQEADTVAIFQFESSGMRDYLRRLKPTTFNDLTAMNALYRPGPMENIPYFIDCKHGRQKVSFDHPALEPILRDTYGVFVYQEQVMAAANVLAGFSLAQGDELRRAMGKKSAEEMEKKRKQFVEGCRTTHKIPEAKAEKIFATMEKFAGYGFNRCLVAETRITEARTGEPTTIGDLFHNRRPFEIHALGDDWKLRPRRVTDVMWNGKKPVFELRTAQGKRITATANHPFRTAAGWTLLEDLAPGTRIAAVGSGVDVPRGSTHGAGPLQVVHEGAPGPLGMAEGTLAVLDPPTDVYWDTIVAIEPRGIQDTYDLTVEDDHNFVADGLIVHNSHSAAYALLAYQSGWLKAHYPAEFMAATLTSEMSDSARIVTLVEECRRMELEILAPDVNRSEWRFAIEDAKIRMGLGAVRNVGQAPVEALVNARAESGPFTDLFDLACRVEGRVLNRRVLESLVAAGACDALGTERGALFAGAGIVLDAAASVRHEREVGQSSLFGDASGTVAVVTPPIPSVPPWLPRDRSTHEKEVLGFYFSEHPLEPLRDLLAKIITHTIADATDLEDGAEVRIAGLVGETRTISTRTGKLMGVVTLEDLSGRIECTLFPETFEATRSLLTPDTIVVGSGRVEKRDERPARLLISEVRPLEEARTVYRRSLHLELRAEDLSEERLADIDQVLSSFPGEAEVYLHIVRPDHTRLAMRSRRFQVAEDDTLAGRLRECLPGLRVRWSKGAP